MSDELITEEWLKEVGFKWHQLTRQPDKHWLLWLGACMPGVDYEDFGIQVAPNRWGDEVKDWFCWLRSDVAHRYSRFLHVRHITKRAELIRMIEGLTGQDWNPANNRHGHMLTPEAAERRRREDERLDLKWMRENPPWREIEKDDSLGGALPEHMEAFVSKKGEAV